jgi:beta-N-acetylhexosaminidase
MAGFEGVKAPPDLLDQIRAGRAGGVILFSRNIESVEQTLELTHSLQSAAADSPRRAPLLIGIDQEGGRVSRVSPDFTLFPAARVFGRIGDPDLARRCAGAVAAELRAVGVNWNFAPVLDILTNPACTVIGDRAYGEEAGAAAAMGAAVITGLQAGGVAAAAKHFPGIGDMAPDPHETLPASGLSLEDLRGRELIPFRAAVSSETSNPGGVASVMVAHAVFGRIDPERPASLSSRLIKELLRGELGFGGVVVTDDLDMGAIENPAEAAVAGLRAGADIVLICRSGKDQEQAHERISRAIRTEEIPAREEEESLGRIGLMRDRYAGDASSWLKSGPGSSPESGSSYYSESGPSSSPDEGHLDRLREKMKQVVGCSAHRGLLDEVMARIAALEGV